MKIDIIENNINKIEDKNLLPMIQLIIEAVREYPLYDLDDLDLYLDEIKKLIASNNINTLIIEDFIKQNQNIDSEDVIWKMSSLSSLLDALDLMKIYKISFEELIEKINSIVE